MERQRGRLFQPVQKISMVKQLPMLKDVDAYFNAVFLGGESKNYNKFVSTDLGKAKSELSQYFSDSLQYSYDETDHIKPTGDEIPKVFGWTQTSNRERGSYSVDNIFVTKDKTEFNIDMSTISMRAADDAYVANHPRLIDDLKTTYKAMVLTLEIATN